MRIAVIGSGISGLSAAFRLQTDHEVVLFESDSRPGGHTHTVDITLGGITAGVDTGFLVFNERTYPLLIALFAELGVPSATTDMSFAASIGPHRIEWCGSNLASLFAQPSNLLRPGFWRMLKDIIRFNREATALAIDDASAQLRLEEPLERYLERERYSTDFRDAYLLPMAAAIWSCPTATMMKFPLGSFVRFFHNHGLLQIEGRPRWMTVPGGARQYVDKILAQLADVRLATPVLAVERGQGARGAVSVRTAQKTEIFDQVVMACHSDQALALLTDADEEERALLGAIRYQPNRALLHTDSALMPARRRAWAAWNYLSDGNPGAPDVSVTYWLNRLQPLPFKEPVFVTLNPLQEPRPDALIREISYAHPVFDIAAGRAQRRLRTKQGERGTWFAGAWMGYGFHEDGLRSGLEVAQALSRIAPSLSRAA